MEFLIFGIENLLMYRLLERTEDNKRTILIDFMILLEAIS